MMCRREDEFMCRLQVVNPHVSAYFDAPQVLFPVKVDPCRRLIAPTYYTYGTRRGTSWSTEMIQRNSSGGLLIFATGNVLERVTMNYLTPMRVWSLQSFCARAQYRQCGRGA